MANPRVLVVEDDPTIGAEVRDALVTSGYEVQVCTSGHDALARARAASPDLVVLDLGLPDLEGLQVCRRLRAEHPNLSIVIVTARDAELDIVVGLDAGATDYVTKPFSMAVLLARLRAHLRDVQPGDDVLDVGLLHLDGAAHRVHLDGDELELRPKEFDLLQLLMEEAGRVVTRDRLLSEVWDLHWESSTKTLDMHVHALRRKLGERPGGGSWISTVRSVGYRFELA